MGTMRGGGMGMGMRAERTPHGRARAPGKQNSQRRKIDVKKLWPQIRALVAPRKGLLMAGLCLMTVNRVAGLVLPYTSKTLLDKVLSPSRQCGAVAAVHRLSCFRRCCCRRSRRSH